MWHEARRSEKKVHDMMDAARKRAQRRAIFLAQRRGDPLQAIQATGTRSRLYRDDALYSATQDQQGLIPWNGKEDVLIDRFDGRALLDFIRDTSSRNFRVAHKTEEEEELEEFVSFERYRDLIKHRRRGFTDEEGLQHVDQELEAKVAALFNLDSKPHAAQPSASKASYSQVGFSYDGDGKAESSDGEENEDDDEDEDEEDFNSDDSNDEVMESIAKEHGVKRYGWLVYMDKKAKQEERRQKEVIKGDPAIRKLSRKERRKASQIGREKEREASRISGIRVHHHDPYRESRQSPTYEAYSRSRRSRSRSYSPSYSRRHRRGDHSEDGNSVKERVPKVEYITEFGGSDADEPKLQGYSPPQSPPSQADALNRPSSGLILEALHVDPASGVSLDKGKNVKLVKPPISASSGLAKLSKGTSNTGLPKQLGEKKETPQERLKRIMNKQLTKQIKKDTAAETAKKREQERHRLEKLEESSRVSRYRYRRSSRSYSRSPPRRYRRSRSPSRGRSRSPGRGRSRSPGRSRSRSPGRSRSSRKRRSHSRSRSRSYSKSRSHSRSISRSRSPRGRRRSRY